MTKQLTEELQLIVIKKNRMFLFLIGIFQKINVILFHRVGCQEINEISDFVALL